MSLATKLKMGGRVGNKARVVECLSTSSKSSREGSVYFECDRRRRDR